MQGNSKTPAESPWTRRCFTKYLKVFVYAFLSSLLPLYIFAKIRGGLKALVQEAPMFMAVSVTITAMILGLLASYWKRHAQGSYGAFEALFGVLLSFSLLLRLAPGFELVKLFGIGSAVYVIARGFNNLLEYHDHQGEEHERYYQEFQRWEQE
jgi:hypothetical protein